VVLLLIRDALFTRATIISIMQGQAHAEIELTDGETAKVDRDSLDIKVDPPSSIVQYIEKLERSGQDLGDLAHVDPRPIIEDSRPAGPRCARMFSRERPRRSTTLRSVLSLRRSLAARARMRSSARSVPLSCSSGAQRLG
jgi:hypothetical protein